MREDQALLVWKSLLLTDDSLSSKTLPLQPGVDFKSAPQALAYLNALSKAGLAEISGASSKTVLFTGSLSSPPVRDDERVRVEAWAMTLAEPDRTRVLGRLAPSNRLRVPDSLHAKLGTNTNLYVVAAIWHELLTTDVPLSTDTIRTALKNHNITFGRDATVILVELMVTAKMIEPVGKGAHRKMYVGLVPDDPAIREDSGLNRWITQLPDPEQKYRAEKRRDQEVPEPPAVRPIIVPATDPTLPKTFTPEQQSTQAKAALATRVWGVLLTHPIPVSQADLITALGKQAGAVSGAFAWLEKAGLLERAGKKDGTTLYQGVVPDSLRTDQDLLGWVAELGTDQQVVAQARFAKPVTPKTRFEPAPIPKQITDRMGIHTKQAPRIWSELLTTDTALTVQELMTRLGEQDIVIGRMSANGYLKELEQVGLAKVHGSIGLGDTYVGVVPDEADKDAVRAWIATLPEKLPDGRSKANALSRLNDIDPLGTTHTPPPLPPNLPSQPGISADLVAAIWGVLLTTTTPLTFKTLADRLQTYGFTRDPKRLGLYLEYMAREDVGLATPIDQAKSGTRAGVFVGAVPPAARQNEQVRDWINTLPDGLAKTDALARLAGHEPLTSPERDPDLKPIKRVGRLAAVDQAIGRKKGEDGRHIIPSHLFRDVLNNWVNHHYPPGHPDRPDRITLLRAKQKTFDNFGNNLVPGHAATNRAMGALAYALTKAAATTVPTEDNPSGPTVDNVLNIINYEGRYRFRYTQRQLIGIVTDPQSGRVSSVEDPLAVLRGIPDPVGRHKYLLDLAASTDFDWPGGTTEEWQQWHTTYLALSTAAANPEEYDYDQLTTLLDTVFTLPKPDTPHNAHTQTPDLDPPTKTNPGNDDDFDDDFDDDDDDDDFDDDDLELGDPNTMLGIETGHDIGTGSVTSPDGGKIPNFPGGPSPDETRPDDAGEIGTTGLSRQMSDLDLGTDPPAGLADNSAAVAQLKTLFAQIGALRHVEDHQAKIIYEGLRGGTPDSNIITATGVTADTLKIYRNVLTHFRLLDDQPATTTTTTGTGHKRGREPDDDTGTSTSTGTGTGTDSGPRNVRARTDTDPQHPLTQLTLNNGQTNLDQQHLETLTHTAHDIAHDTLTRHHTGLPPTPITITTTNPTLAGTILNHLNQSVARYLADNQAGIPPQHRLTTNPPITTTITSPAPGADTATITIPTGTTFTPAPPPTTTNPTTSSTSPNAGTTPSTGTDLPPPDSTLELPASAQGTFGDQMTTEDQALLVWKTLLLTDDSLNTTTLLQQPGVGFTSVAQAGRYLSALSEAGLAEINGVNGRHMLYTGSLSSPPVRDDERVRVEAWAMTLAEPDRTRVLGRLAPSNRLRVPDSLHAKLGTGTNLYVAAAIWHELLTTGVPLSYDTIRTALKNHNITIGRQPIGVVVDQMVTAKMIEPVGKGAFRKMFVGLVPDDPAIREDSGLNRWITHLPDPEQKYRAEKRRDQEVPEPPAVRPIIVPATDPTLPKTFTPAQQSSRAKAALAMRVWGVLLTHPHAVSQADLGTALSKHPNLVGHALSWLEKAGLLERAGKKDGITLYQGVVPDSLRTDQDLLSWMAELDTDQQVVAQARFDSAVTPKTRLKPAPIPKQITNQMGMYSKQAPRIWSELLTTDTALTVQGLMTRLGEQDIDVSTVSASGYLRTLQQVGLAKAHSSIGQGDAYVGVVPDEADKDAVRAWIATLPEKLPDGRSKANALSRLNDIEPLGTTHTPPPLPPNLPSQPGISADVVAAIWGVLLTATTLLTVKTLADRLQTYGLVRESNRLRLYLEYMAREDVGLAAPIGAAGAGARSGFSAGAVPPAARQNEQLSDWINTLPDGLAKTDALARLAGHEPLTTPERQNPRPIKRVTIRKAVGKAIGRKDGEDSRHIIPSHLFLDVLNNWINHHYPPGHPDRLAQITLLQVKQKTFDNLENNLVPGHAATNRAMGFLAKSLTKAAATTVPTEDNPSGPTVDNVLNIINSEAPLPLHPATTHRNRHGPAVRASQLRRRPPRGPARHPRPHGQTQVSARPRRLHRLRLARRHHRGMAAMAHHLPRTQHRRHHP